MAATAVDPVAAPQPALTIPTLAGARLRLRPLQKSDLDRVVELANDAHIAAMTVAIPHPYKRSDADDWLAHSISSAERGEEIAWVIADLASDQVVGAIALTLNPLRKTVATVGYWVGRPFWGQGFALEAARLVLRYAFSDLGLDAVGAWARPENAASIRVMEKLGLKPTDGLDLHRPDDCRVAVARRIGRADFQASEVITRSLTVVAVALVDGDGRVLLAQRPPGKAMAGLWEFPGGKLNPGETPEAALIRELKEELDIDVSASCLAPFTFASHTYADFHLLMPLYVCRVWEGHPKPVEGQVLAWATPIEMTKYPMPAADKPLIAMLRDLL